MTQPTPAYQKRWRHDQHNGLPRTIDAEPVRLHLASLRGADMSLRAIAAAAGLASSCVARVAAGQATVKRPTAARILAVQPHVPAVASRQTAQPFVSKVGAVRRIQALLAMGWRHGDIGAAAGLSTRTAHSSLICSQRGRWVTRETHDKVAIAYRTLSGRPGPSERTRSRAAKRGYLSPAYWDDIDLDVGPDFEEAAA